MDQFSVVIFHECAFWLKLKNCGMKKQTAVCLFTKLQNRNDSGQESVQIYFPQDEVRKLAVFIR